MKSNPLAKYQKQIVQVAKNNHISYLALFGSYARGDWGVGSDLDLVVIVDDAELSPVERRRRYEPTHVPVPADVWVYTRSEWSALADHSPHLARRLEVERLDLALE